MSRHLLTKECRLHETFSKFYPKRLVLLLSKMCFEKYIFYVTLKIAFFIRNMDVYNFSLSLEFTLFKLFPLQQ